MFRFSEKNMAAEKPLFFTFRKHKKKSIAAAIASVWLVKYGVDKFRDFLIRREFCNVVEDFGKVTLPALQKPRRLLVFFNPTSGKGGKALSLFQKNAEPIFHLAGVDITVIRTDYEGQVKTLMQYIDPTVDGIVIAGGDGTIQEVVTGLLRRSDQERVSKLPLGVIPLGKSNTFFRRLFTFKSGTQARQIGSAAMAIVKGSTKPVDVIEIKGGDGKPTFAMCGVHWGSFRDAEEREDKFWLAGQFRRKLSFVSSALRYWPPGYRVLLSYPNAPQVTSVIADSNIPQSSPAMAGQSSLPGLTAASCEEKSTACIQNSNKDITKHGWTVSDLQVSGIDIEPTVAPLGSASGLQGHLKVSVWSSEMTKKEFIMTGWRMEECMKNQDEIESEHNKCLHVKEVKLEPDLDKVSWFTIDGEEFEARPIHIKLHPNKLNFFCTADETKK